MTVEIILIAFIILLLLGRTKFNVVGTNSNNILDIILTVITVILFVRLVDYLV